MMLSSICFLRIHYRREKIKTLDLQTYNTGHFIMDFQKKK